MVAAGATEGVVWLALPAIETQKLPHGTTTPYRGLAQLVRSDLGGAGVMFSIDTETGFAKVVLINAACGLGENVVQGAVDPDEYEVFKPFWQTSKSHRFSRRSAARRRSR